MPPRILLIEDDARLAAMVADYLGAAGLRVSVAGAGEAWDSVDASADAARDRARGVFGRFTSWLGTWGGKGR